MIVTDLPAQRDGVETRVVVEHLISRTARAGHLVDERRVPVKRQIVQDRFAARPAARAAAVTRGAKPAFNVVVGLLILIAIALPLQAAARSAPASFADLAEKLLPAVVNISTSQVSRERGRRGPEIPRFPPGSPFEEFFRDFFEQNRPDAPPRRTTALGSGFIVDPGGYIVTNNHVISEADDITVIFQDDTKLKAEVVGRDAKTDLALLKVDTDKPLPFVEWGDSSVVRVGDWVIAIGNPFGLGGTVTAGIISATARNINSGPYDDYLQTDASINRGNSGGPLFNLKGEVIGVTTSILSPSGGSIGLGFAAPSSLAKTVIGQLREFGRARRGWLGVRIQTVTDEIAESLGLEDPGGALVAGVMDDGPAKEAGIEAGDVILSFDDKKVEDMRRLPRIVADTPIDKVVDVVIWRKGEEVTLKVKVDELKEETVAKASGAPAAGEEGAIEMLGLTLSGITAALRQRFNLDEEVTGVLITHVSDDSTAKEKGIRAGEIIREISQDKVETPADVKSMVEKARSAKRKSVLLLIERENDQRFVVLPIS